MTRLVLAGLLCGAAATENATRKQYQLGYVRMPRNGLEVVAEITDEMRAAAPASLDWSATGATTPVKDQGGCGSCWAYSATEGVESGYYMATGELISLSEQQMISCDTNDLKCQGGDLPTAFQYVQEAGGLDTQDDYPDTSSTSGFGGQCKAFTPAVKISEWKYAIPACPRRGACLDQQESDMMAALNSFGPLSVCVNAETWSFYTGGVYSRSCSGAEASLDHCVQLVGYDTTGSESYWKVRNSWAADWGENGFIRLAMGINQCGIADEATYVIASAAEAEISV